MKVKTYELADEALNYVVGVIEYGEKKVFINPTLKKKGIWVIPQKNGAKTHFHPTKSWQQGGRIIEREEIGTKRRAPCMRGEEWEAAGSITAKGAGYSHAYGSTPLIAAMRCYVSSKLGEEVDVPEELI